MPMLLKGSCRCGAVHLRGRKPHACPLPALLLLDLPQAAGRRRLLPSILVRMHDTLTIYGQAQHRRLPRRDRRRRKPDLQTFDRRAQFLQKCGSALWLYDPTWPELVHPFASAIDSELPMPPERVHLMLKYKASWVEPDIRQGDESVRPLSGAVDRRLAPQAWRLGGLSHGRDADPRRRGQHVVARFRRRSGRAPRQAASGPPASVPPIRRSRRPNSGWGCGR